MSQFEIFHSYLESSLYALKCTLFPIFSDLWHFLRILCRFLCFWFFQILPTILSAGTVAVNTNSYTIGCCMKSIEYRVTKIWQLVFKWYGKNLKPFLLVYLFVYWFNRIKTSRVKMTPLSVQIVGKNLLVVLGLKKWLFKSAFVLTNFIIFRPTTLSHQKCISAVRQTSFSKDAK